VRRGAQKERPEAVPVEGDVTIRITYYYLYRGIDVDNLSKPICDALSRLIYLDDGQVTDLYAAKRNLKGFVAVADSTAILLGALETANEFIHVTVDFSEVDNSQI
jgi:hypothetical protein